jgi:hypothetical protein
VSSFFFKAGKIDFENYISESIIFIVYKSISYYFSSKKTAFQNAIPNMGNISSFLKINDNKSSKFFTYFKYIQYNKVP